MVCLSLFFALTCSLAPRVLLESLGAFHPFRRMSLLIHSRSFLCPFLFLTRALLIAVAARLSFALVVFLPSSMRNVFSSLYFPALLVFLACVSLPSALI